MKTYAGYINLKPINGVIFPSYAQNQINRNYIVTKLKGEFFLSTNENTYGKNNIIKPKENTWLEHRIERFIRENIQLDIL